MATVFGRGFESRQLHKKGQLISTGLFLYAIFLMFQYLNIPSIHSTHHQEFLPFAQARRMAHF